MNLTGINRRELDALVRELGGTVEPVRRTGEVEYRHPRLSRPLRFNGRKKSVPWKVATAVSKLREEGTR